MNYTQFTGLQDVLCHTRHDVAALPMYLLVVIALVVTFAFLSSLPRDLTAQNILISERNTAKVSNFELTRDAALYLSGCKFPIKWTAPEAIDDGVSVLDVREIKGRCTWGGQNQKQTDLLPGVIPYRNLLYVPVCMVLHITK